MADKGNRLFVKILNRIAGCYQFLQRITESNFTALAWKQDIGGCAGNKNPWTQVSFSECRLLTAFFAIFVVLWPNFFIQWAK